jgi:hypothetical protein
VRKIFTLLIVLLVMMMLPLVSFAKVAISEKDLNDITAQEGVTINFGCFTLGAITIAVSSWGDSDGCSTCGGYSSAGWIGASISMSSNFVGISGNMTIDVGSSGTRTALIIGLPGLSLAGSMSQVVELASNNQLTANPNGVLGTSYMSGVQVSPSGYLVIFAH